MPKLSKRRMHLRTLQVKKLCLIDTVTPQEADISGESDSGHSYSEESDGLSNTEINFVVDDIAELFQLCLEKTDLRRLSVLMLTTLKFLNVSWREIDSLLKNIGALSHETSNKWAHIFKYGDFDEFCAEHRGGKRADGFYDVFPEIEGNAKAFAISSCSRKSSDFTVKDLAVFINDQYRAMNMCENDENDCLVRSLASCRLDLRAWGARFEANSQRPYFEGHERLR